MEYSTDQKRTLLAFFEKNQENSYTIEEISENISVGKSTIYRLMPKMIEQGLVMRFSKEKSRHFYYQYMSCHRCHSHLHMKCTSCGKIIHMNSDISKSILDNIKNGDDFTVDSEETILLGKCSVCSKA